MQEPLIDKSLKHSLVYEEVLFVFIIIASYEVVSYEFIKNSPTIRTKWKYFADERKLQRAMLPRNL